MKTLIINNNVINTPIINILNDIKKQLTNGKLKYFKIDGNDIRCTCPHHKGGKEDKPSCGVYVGDSSDEVKYGDFNCFTCGTHGPFFRFVAECFDKDEEWAKQWLIDNYGDGTENQLIDLPEIVLTKNRKKVNNYLDESILSTFQSWHPYIEKRKISRKIASLFQIKYDTRSQCIVFPVYDENNKLLMLTRRSVNNKTFIIDKDKEKPIYLLNYIKEKNIDTVIVAESQINALYAWSLGYPAIATFGCNITPKQFSILNKSPIKHYYLAMDGDEAGDHGIQLFLDSINPSAFVDIMLLPQGKDINDLSADEFDKLPIISSQEWLHLHKKKK